MKKQEKILSFTMPFNIRFSEVDSMNIVWHGNYMQYFEDAREAFGKVYDLDYLTIFHHGYYAPLVDISFSYRHPLAYGMKPVITIDYLPTDSAKIIFEYTIHDSENGATIATGRSVQVFMDMNYELVLCNPSFYEEWKKNHIAQFAANDNSSIHETVVRPIDKEEER